MASRLKEKGQSLDADQLRAISAALPGKLRAHQVSEAFIDRYTEELVQQALSEYARVCERGQAIDNPGGWIVNTAFRRAIDQLRREAREATIPLSTEAALEVTDGSSAPPDEEAIRHIEAEQLHRAIRRLSVPQRQALSLYYFEERSTREGADALGWSEPTFRRRRDSALRALRERFGVIKPVPQQGDRTAIEVGLAAWLSLAGAQGHAGRITDQLVAVADSVRGGITSLAGRLRDFAARLLSSGGGEGIVNAASGPIGKTAGVCGAAAAAAMCVTGVIGPGVGGIDLLHEGSAPKSHPAHERPGSRVEPKAPVRPTHSTPEVTAKPELAAQPTHRSSSSGSGGAEARARRATRAASSQFAPESAVEPTPSSPEPEPEPAPAPESSPAPSPTQTANEQFGP
jgi:RNA polymerase sigma factor (sigma-70 family)